MSHSDKHRKDLFEVAQAFSPLFEKLCCLLGYWQALIGNRAGVFNEPCVECEGRVGGKPAAAELNHAPCPQCLSSRHGSCLAFSFCLLCPCISALSSDPTSLIKNWAGFFTNIKATEQNRQSLHWWRGEETVRLVRRVSAAELWIAPKGGAVGEGR